ncbi:MAG TPA: ATP-binding protein [Terriglobia bacterium]|nr:ATP-binding protein [Terriglobia bacterium]
MGLDFSKLASLRLRSQQILEDQVASLEYFACDGGYQQYKGKDKISVSSSATCVLSLVATGEWKASKAETKALLEKLIAKKTSAGLPDDNPFTVAWILEAVTALQEQHSDPLEPNTIARIAEMELILQGAAKSGGVSIGNYPSTAYLTQLVVRALRHRSKLTEDLEKAVNSWAWGELPYQIGLVQAKSKTADAFAVAYLVMLVTAVTPRYETTPEQTSIQRAGLKIFFDCQRKDDGTWPLSRPLFHYEKFGNAYCYEYEMLTQLLSEPRLEDLLLDYLPNLSAAVDSVSQSAYSVKEGIQAWTSGHHPQLKFPESWATASVYHFVHVLDRLLAEAVRRELFHYLDLPFPDTVARDDKAVFAQAFLDSIIVVDNKPRPLRDFLLEGFVKPLAAEADGIAKGLKFKKGTPRSAIFFGPPGTSKTELSKEIAKFLGWPHLSVDPSFLLRNGMDGIQAEANTIFRMLEETERVAVLFDEFDEFVRERGSSDAQQFSRLLTTAMLPKLASIHKRATLVFIIATNNIQQFDLAIQRPGRFDRVVQIMPPTYAAKVMKKDWGADENVDIEERLKTLGVTIDDQITKPLEDLTFLECDAFATKLAKVKNGPDAVRVLVNQWERCILNVVTQDDKKTWKERCKDEEQFNR